MTVIESILNYIDPMTAATLSFLTIVLFVLKIQHERLKIKQIEDSMNKGE